MKLEFGSFEAGREVARTALGGVWTCHPKSGSRPENDRAAKALLPDEASIPDEQWLASHTAYFLERANLLKRLAESPHWLPIYEIGTLQGGAYYVTDCYDNSIHRLLTGQVEPTARLLFSLADAVVGGLSELKELCQCSHGNLRPTNVLISRSGKLARPIVLTDPLPGTVPATAANEAADLRALGEMLARIVLRRPTSTGSVLPVWPLPDAPQWRQLGRTSEEWREFCNFLLDPYSPPESRNLAEARRQLDVLGKSARRGSGHKLRWAMAACIALVLAGGTIGYRRLHQTDADIVKAPAKFPTSIPAPPPPPVREELLARANREGWVTSPNPAMRELGRAAALEQLSDDAARRIESLADEMGAIVFAPGVKPEDIPQLPAGFAPWQADNWKKAIVQLTPPGEPDPRNQMTQSWVHSLGAAEDQIHSPSVSPKVLVAANNLKAAMAAPELTLPWTLRNREQILSQVNDVGHKAAALDIALREPPPPDPHDKVRQFIASEKQRTDLSDSQGAVVLPAIQSLWHDRHEQLLRGIEQSPDQMTTGSEQISRLAAALVRLNTALAVDPALAAQGETTAQMSAFEAAVTAGRSAQVSSALKAFPPPPYDAVALKQIDDESLHAAQIYKLWCDRVKTVRQGLARSSDGLDLCYLPDEKLPSTDRTVRQFLAECHAETSEPWTPLVGQVQERIKQLDGLAALKAPDVLSSMRDATPVTILALWRQLGRLTDAWPAQIADFQAELATEQVVTDRVVPIRPDVKAELQAGRVARWNDHLRLAATAGADTIRKTVEWAAAHPSQIPASLESLPAWFQFDLLLYQYQTDPKTRTDLASFRTSAAKLEAAPAVRTFLLRMDEQMKPRTGLTTPQRAAVPLGRPRPLGDALSYTAMDGQIKVTFIRVQPKDPTIAPFYMGTTEVSIGLFANIVAQGTPGRYFNQVSQLLPNADTPQRWIGPHGWELDSERRLLIPRRNMWCDDFQFKNGQRPIPLPEHPMQYVTPEAALYLARLIGCRLPTADEWREAYDYSKRKAASSPDECAWVMMGWKLRDSLWDEERDQAIATAASRWLDDGIFGSFPIPFGTHAEAASWMTAPWSQRLQKEKAATVAQISAANRQKDGRLNALVANNTVLFRPCSYNFNECFHDLVGNVAEFVLDPGSAIRAETELPPESPEKVAAFFQSPQTKLYVIGGSALSPPEFGFDQPLPVTHEQTLNGFSDVGFRLVFTDPSASPRVQFDLASAQYLLGDQPPVGTPAEARR